MNGQKESLGEEHKEFFRDLSNVIISYTPISGVIDTVKFMHKWVVKKDSPRRIVHHIKRKGKRLKLKRTKQAN